MTSLLTMGSNLTYVAIGALLAAACSNESAVAPPPAGTGGESLVSVDRGTKYPGLTFYAGLSCRAGAPSPGIFTEAHEALGVDFVHEPEVDDEEGLLVLDFGGVGIADLDADNFLDLYFTNAGGPDRTYLTGGRGAARFEALDVGMEQSNLVVTLVDMDADGDVDALVAQDEASWLENDGTGRFVERYAVAPGTPAEEHTLFGFAVGDVSGDGWLDVLVAVHEVILPNDDREWPGKEWLLHGSAAGLVNATTSLPDRPVEDWTFLASLADLDDDGDLDIYEFNDAFSLAVKGLDANDWVRQGNRLYRNDGGGIWSDLTDVEGGPVVTRTAMGGAIGDYNNDGLLDIYVTTMRPEANALLRNDGALQFSEIALDVDADTLLDEHDVGWGAMFLDADADGYQDLLVLHGWLTDFDYEIGPTNFQSQANVLLKNIDGASFEDVTTLSGLAGAGTWSRSPAVGDLNRDGFPDIVVGNANGTPGVYLNGCDSRPWLTVRLNQTGPNVYGIGSRIRVTAAGMTQTRFVEAGGNGLYGSSAPEAYFALPAGTESVTLEVRWPGANAEVSQWVDVPVRHIVTASPTGD